MILKLKMVKQEEKFHPLQLKLLFVFHNHLKHPFQYSYFHYLSKRFHCIILLLLNYHLDLLLQMKRRLFVFLLLINTFFQYFQKLLKSNLFH
ncbi:MAG: hypothetical protein EBR82_33550 [Caulobacteraceae bacterium]|nr:hypothetical protein [Caulobacteraceae bacterium]